jgi:hypothetical protein
MALEAFSVTCEWENEQGGEWVKTLAVLAGSVDAARVCAQAFISERFGISVAEVTTTTAGAWRRPGGARVIGELVVMDDAPPMWLDR